MTEPAVAKISPGVSSLNEEEIIATYWRRHKQWSILASRLKTDITRWRAMTLGLGALGALLQTLSTLLGRGRPGTVICVIGTIALMLVPFIVKYFLSAEQVRQWLRARSASEGLKSLIYRFQARATPFAGADRVAVLFEVAKRAEEWVEALAVELSGIPNRDDAPLAPLDAEAYLDLRVTAQIEGYYRRRARRNTANARRFRNFELSAATLAAVFGAAATALKIAPSADGHGGLGAWVAVITTIGGAIAAHAAANRYDLQARMFFATARRLEDLRNEWIAHGKPLDVARWSEFVNACEDAISTENRGWMAKLDPEERQTG